MSSFSVINGVTRTLGSVLTTATGVTVESDRSPSDPIPSDVPLIHLYLYQVQQNPFFTNNDWLRPSETSLQEAPIGLNLFYLLTPYGSGQLQIQLTLGEIIQVFHENPVIAPSAFDATLADTTEQLRVVPHPLSFQEMTELWQSFEGRSYRLSLSYEVSAVLIDSRRSRAVRRVRERQLEVRPG